MQIHPTIKGGPISGATAMNSLAAIKTSPPKTPEQKKMWEAAEQVEATFLGMLLKEMEKTVEKGSLFHGGMGEEMFQDALDNEYVKSFGKQSTTGLAWTYYQQLVRHAPQPAENS